MPDIGAEKVEGREQLVPSEWRETLKRIADAFAARHLPKGDSIRRIDAKTAEVNFDNIRGYRDTIGPLTEASWDTSVCAWMGDHWEVLVDLTTVEGARSDLVLHARAFDIGGRVEFEPGLIYVP